MYKTCLRSDLAHHCPIFSRSVAVCRPQRAYDRPNGLNTNQLSLVTKGHGILILRDERYELAEGDMFFLKERDPHVYFGTDADFSLSWLTFQGDCVAPLLSYYGVEHSDIYRNKNLGSFDKKIRKLCEIFDSDISFPHLMGKVYETVVSFFDEIACVHFTHEERIKAFLERHYAEPLILDDIFHGIGYSKSKLCADFKRFYGKTVFEVLTDIRLQNAKQMLEENREISVKSVAVACGFRDCSYFCRLYRRTFQQSPRGK